MYHVVARVPGREAGRGSRSFETREQAVDHAADLLDRLEVQEYRIYDDGPDTWSAQHPCGYEIEVLIRSDAR